MPIPEALAMEQILIRNLPVGTKAALRARAARHHRSVDAEARAILVSTLSQEPVTIVELEPRRLKVTGPIPEP
ncbi:MAG: Arc family DNA-binding protein [Solirubrobacteraceae bacterium]|nr:Arc family DNA-binding protein [Solirubrobacteraceae bacterium]